MSSESNIEHSGVVLSTQGKQVVVEIVSSSACRTCQAAQMCTSSESKTKQVKAYMAEGYELKAGDRVKVEGKSSMGMKAVLLAYVVPLLIMVGVIVCCKVAGQSDAMGGIIGMLALVPYFIGLYMKRDKLNKEFIFSAKPE